MSQTLNHICKSCVLVRVMRDSKAKLVFGDPYLLKIVVKMVYILYESESIQFRF